MLQPLVMHAHQAELGCFLGGLFEAKQSEQSSLLAKSQHLERIRGKWDLLQVHRCGQQDGAAADGTAEHPLPVDCETVYAGCSRSKATFQHLL